MDSIFAEHQQPLLVEPLYLSPSWAEGRPFLATANVGLFYKYRVPPVVPDMMLALGVQLGSDPMKKENRSFFTWIHRKVPDATVEVVSNLEGGEEDRKFILYEQLGVRYYVIFDPAHHLKNGVLRVFGRHPSGYLPESPDWLEGIGLGLRLVPGRYRDMDAVWLRWCDRNGVVLPNGPEFVEQQRQALGQERQRVEQEGHRAEQQERRAEQERQRAEQQQQQAERERQRAEQQQQRAERERQRAEQERQRAEQERQRAERLAAQLRSLGIDPSA